MAKLDTKRAAAPAPIAIRPAGAGEGVPAPEIKRPRHAYILETCTNLTRAAADGPIRVLLPATARIRSA